MLQAIRERTQGWFAWGVVMLISIPFALWGIQEYVKVGSQKPVAKVNGYEIQDRELSQRLQQTRLELRRRFGKAYRPELFDQAMLRKEVLADMIRNHITIESSLNMGIRVGDGQVQATILGMSAFQKDGKFDNATYEQLLSMQNTTPVAFEEQVRSSLMTTQLNRMVSSSEFITPQELTESVSLLNQQRSFKYFLLPITAFKSDKPITDTELDDYYQAHRDLYELPEQVKIDYLVLDQTSNAPTATEEVTESSLKAMYDAHLQQYQVPEQRQIRHILVTLAANASATEQKSAENKIAAIRARIVKGEDFATVAKEVSEDPGSAAQGGDLGMVGRGVMDPKFEAAAFTLSKNSLSEPVHSSFGLHLIEVTKIIPEKLKTFAEVKNELIAAVRAEQIEKNYLSMAERLGNLAYEHPDSLEPVAQTLGLTIQHSDWLSRSSGTGILANSKITDVAFADEILNNGNNSDVIEIAENGQQQAVVLRVVDHKDITIKPLSAVKDQVITAIRQEQNKQAALAQGEALAARLRKGELLNTVATGYTVIEQGLTKRDATGNNIPAEILTQVFALPATTDKIPSVGVIQQQDGTAAVIMLGAIKQGQTSDLDENKTKQTRSELANSQAQTYYDNMITDLLNRADIWLAPQDEQRSVAVD